MIPRVTEILGIIRDPDYEKFRDSSPDRFEEVMAKAAERGRSWDKIVTAHVDGEITPAYLADLERDFPLLFSAYEQFSEWARDNVASFLLCQERVISKAYGYCGTPDFVCLLKKGKVIIYDSKFKVKIPYKDHLQLAGYKRPAEDVIGRKINGRVILHFQRTKKTGEDAKVKMKIIPLENDSTDYAAFLTVLHIYKKTIGVKNADSAKESV